MIYKKVFLLIITSLVLLTVLFGQNKNTGKISGLIKDADSKSPLLEAVVTLKSSALEGQKFALTDSTGNYRVNNLPAGDYTISFEMEGYEKFVQQNIVLKDGMWVKVNYDMLKEGKKNKLVSK